MTVFYLALAALCLSFLTLAALVVVAAKLIDTREDLNALRYTLRRELGSDGL